MQTNKEQTGTYRYKILALLFAATTINYMDRSIIGVLGPTLQYKIFHWTDIDYAFINICFKSAYALGLLIMGGIIDKFGTRLGYTISICVWSFFGMLHALIRPAFSMLGFAIARIGLGLGESGNFPAAVKTVAEWFPRKDRAFATGLFNSGTNVGAILAPLVIPLVVMADGTHWQYAFLTTGIFSAIWVIIWLKIYRSPQDHRKLTNKELNYIQSDSEFETKQSLSWVKVLPLRQTWAFALGKFTDAAWWFYLFWGGKFLFDKFGLNIKELALPLVIIYLIADFGSIGGGWLSSHYIKTGWTVNKARKITMLICACFIFPVVFVTQVPSYFLINKKSLHEISLTTFSEKIVCKVNGTITEQKVVVVFPKDILTKLEPLNGKSYDAARDLVNDIKPLIVSKHSVLLEGIILAKSRQNEYYWIAVLLIALAAAGHQAWSANLYTIVSDVFPKKATASVIGIGGMSGAVAGLTADYTLGQVLTVSGTGGYFIAFLLAGIIYLLMLGIIHLMMPSMQPLDENLNPIIVSEK